jgi:hypothetical protein
MKGDMMELTNREFWTLVHGMGLGALFLLSFGGGLAGLYSYRTRYLTAEGVAERSIRLDLGTAVMAVVAWLTVFTGSWIVYPWYRAEPDGAKFQLLANPNTADWHNFAMEWKEHVAWIAPLLATAVAFAVIYYGRELVKSAQIRKGLIAFFTAAFLIAGVAGLLGALITKAGPVR